MARSEEPEFRLRPRKARRPKGQAQKGYAWAAAFKAIMHQARMSRRAGTRSKSRMTPAFSQRCSVRGSYSRNTTKGQWRAHGRYLSRDSALKQGAAQEPGFDATDMPVNIPERLNAWQASGDERLWRFIVSPEFGERLDLKKLTRNLMARVALDLDRSIEWVAVAHFNTEHPHVHIAVRGRDSTSNEVRFDREYIKSGLRAISEDLCTRQLGYRTTVDAEYAQKREATQPYFTSLDRLIGRQAMPVPAPVSNRFLFTLPEPTSPRRLATVQALAVRASVLTRMGLAEQVDVRSWSVRRDFESVLRSMKRGRDRQKTLAAHGAPISDERLLFVTVDYRRLRQIEGRVLVHGEDEVGVGAGRPYLLIEGTDGQVHHVPYISEIQDARHQSKLRVNSFVRLRRLFVDGRPLLEINDFGDAEALLRNHAHFASEARRLAVVGVEPRESGWGGWLGRYHRQLQDSADDLRRLKAPEIPKDLTGRSR